MFLPAPADARTWIGGALGALGGLERMHDLQREIVDDLGVVIYGFAPGEVIEPLSTETILTAGVGPELRAQMVRLAVVLELTDRALERSTTRGVEQFAARLGVRTVLVHEARQLAEHHTVLLHTDLLRHSWTARETAREALSGKVVELVRSKLSYLGIGHDDTIADRWRSLRDLPDGTWGRGVADFYERHGFAFPGEPHGIYEIGARHDFIHVLADYDATPEGELDTFALIAATMPDEEGLTLLAVTLGIFQNGSIRHMSGKRVVMARSDTLADPGAAKRWVDAFRRGAACSVDLMAGIDHFAMADLPIDEARRQVGLTPART
jgi:hypothetical protein